MSEKMEFKAEVNKMLDIVINSLYSEKQIFLRELISNASDACDKIKYMALINPDLAKDAADLKIKIVPDAENKTLKIIDNGIGLNKDDLINHLGTIAESRSRRPVYSDVGGKGKRSGGSREIHDRVLCL